MRGAGASVVAMPPGPRLVVPVTALAAVLGGFVGAVLDVSPVGVAEVVTVPAAPPETRTTPPPPTASAAGAVTVPVEQAPQPSTPADLVPLIEEQVLALANQARASAGLAPLERLVELDAVARGWSALMAEQNLELGHNPDYTSQIPAGWSTAAENVAWIGQTRLTSAEDVAGRVHQSWMDSPGHHANLMNPEHTHIGIGVAFSPERGFYLTQNFAAY